PVPIIALTAHALDSERRQLLQCGMNDYLSKPVTAEQLRQTLTKWTGMLTQEMELPPLAASLFNPAPRRPPAPALSPPGRARPAPQAVTNIAEKAVLDAEEGLQLAAGKA